MLLELILNGLVQGSLLSLISIGYSLAYGSAQVINFPHADVLITGGGYLVLLWINGPLDNSLSLSGMAFLFSFSTIIALWPWQSRRDKNYVRDTIKSILAGFIVFFLTRYFAGKLDFISALILAMPWTAFMATAIYRIGYLKLIANNAPRTSILLSALGFVIAIESLLMVFWGSDKKVFPINKIPKIFLVEFKSENPNFWDNIIQNGVISISKDITLPIYDFFIILIFLIVSVILFYFFKSSILADAIIGTADSRLAARSCGIPVKKIFAYSFFIGGLIASLGGTFFVLRAKSMDPTSGFSIGILAFVACVMGGIGNLKGSILGSFLVSFIISLAPAIPLPQLAEKVIPDVWLKYIPSLNLNDWSYGMVYLLMILTIFIKPRGLFSK